MDDGTDARDVLENRLLPLRRGAHARTVRHVIFRVQFASAFNCFRKPPHGAKENSTVPLFRKVLKIFWATHHQKPRPMISCLESGYACRIHRSGEPESERHRGQEGHQGCDRRGKKVLPQPPFLQVPTRSNIMILDRDVVIIQFFGRGDQTPLKHRVLLCVEGGSASSVRAMVTIQFNLKCVVTIWEVEDYHSRE